MAEGMKVHALSQSSALPIISQQERGTLGPAIIVLVKVTYLS